VVVSRPAGFFAEAIATVAALALLALALVFSLILFAVLISAALAFVAYLCWVSRKVTR
jgi:hypothetical protein